MVALLLMGSAILLFSCGSAESKTATANNEALMTERSEDLKIQMSENGRRSYHFQTALLEGYTLASDPYREFRKGIHITTYQDDSLSTVNATLVANYAIYYEKRELWEAKGDVVVEKADGTRLYTQQLFWNSKTGRIYSNVDSKIVKGTDIFMGEGFESDEELKEWRFRRMSGKMLVNMEPTESPDSTAAATPAPATKPAKGDDKKSKSVERKAESQKQPEPTPRESRRKSEERERKSSGKKAQHRPLTTSANKRTVEKSERMQVQKAAKIERIEE